MKMGANLGQRIGVRLMIILFWFLFVGMLLLIPRCTFFSRHARTINIFTWPALLDVEYLKQFEQETGVSINVSYYETNEELLSKLRATGGQGYDLIIPSDYVVPSLVKENLIKRIDKAQLPCFDRIDLFLCDHYFDPGNNYSVPYFWALYVLGIDTRYFGKNLPEASWALVFDPLLPYRVGMTDSVREAITLAAFYAFGERGLHDITAHASVVADVLMKQKKRVCAYTEANAVNLLLGESAPVVVALGPDMLRAKREYPFIDLVVPREGSFYLIDSFVLSRATDKDELVYSLINYLYRPEVIRHHVAKFGFSSPVRSLQSVDEIDCCPFPKSRAEMNFFKYSIPNELLNDIWILLMVS